jgi:hypothetical protein
MLHSILVCVHACMRANLYAGIWRCLVRQDQQVKSHVWSHVYAYGSLIQYTSVKKLWFLAGAKPKPRTHAACAFTHMQTYALECIHSCTQSYAHDAPIWQMHAHMQKLHIFTETKSSRIHVHAEAEKNGMLCNAEMCWQITNTRCSVKHIYLFLEKWPPACFLDTQHTNTQWFSFSGKFKNNKCGYAEELVNMRLNMCMHGHKCI